MAPTETVDSKAETEKVFAKTLPGILKIAEIVFSLLGFICALVPRLRTSARVVFFLMVSFLSLVITGWLFLCFQMRIHERFSHLPWLRIDFLTCLTSMAACLVASAALTPWGGYIAAYGAACFFGFSAMICYGMDTFIKFQVWRNWEESRRRNRQPPPLQTAPVNT